jgi:aspartyl-tRNA(Asn)/glutamyl-tRNA(Gln) amidotransferase subunit A
MLRKSAREIAAAVNGGEADPVEVAEVFVARILENNSSVNALVRFDPEIARSEALDVRQRIRAGEAMPLAGVPVIVKDNIWVAGRTISQGSRLFADYVAQEDAMAVARLRRAGAVIVGIGNSPEFACKGVTNSPLHGPTQHPLNATLTPGGSSGGNAAALAADFAPVALGTDGGGSGRRPSAHTGTVGFKPSFGAVPYGPGFPEPFWGISVLAPMGRSVDDVAILFEAVAGADARDVESAAIEAGLCAEPRQLRVAFSRDLGLGAPIDADVETTIADGIDLLAKAGWRIDRIQVQWPQGIGESSIMPLQAAGLAAIHGDAWRRKPDLFDPDIAVQIERGLSLTGADVGRALEASAAIKRTVAHLFADHDLLLCPTAPCVAWPLTELGPKQIGGVDVPPRGHAVFTPLFNHALVPAISIPCGRGRDGLPVGLQMVARRGRDRTVLAAAAEAERILAPINDYPRY